MCSPKSKPPGVDDSMRRRFWVSATLSVPLLVLGMFGESLWSAPRATTLHWIELALPPRFVLWGGSPFFPVLGLTRKSLSQHVHAMVWERRGVSRQLIATISRKCSLRPSATCTAASPFISKLQPYYSLVLLGQVLELRARSALLGAIRALLNLAPQQAHRIAADGSKWNSLTKCSVAIACASPGRTHPVTAHCEGASAVMNPW